MKEGENLSKGPDHLPPAEIPVFEATKRQRIVGSVLSKVAAVFWFVCGVAISLPLIVFSVSYFQGDDFPMRVFLIGWGVAVFGFIGMFVSSVMNGVGKNLVGTPQDYRSSGITRRLLWRAGYQVTSLLGLILLLISSIGIGMRLMGWFKGEWAPLLLMLVLGLVFLGLVVWSVPRGEDLLSSRDVV